MAERNILLFDFDGVIINSVAMLDTHVMTYWGMGPEDHKNKAEGNIHAESVGEAAPAKLDAEEERVFGEFAKVYAKDMFSCDIFPGMREVLERAAETYTLYVVSSSTSELIRTYLEHCGVVSLFAGIYGMDVALSKSVKIGMIAEREQALPTNMLMITDTLGDIREATHAGVESIGVTWGLHERERLQKGSPWGIYDTPGELSKAIEAYFAEV